jgi:hypothetical protein
MIIQLRRMRWADRVACMGEMSTAPKILMENLKGKDHPEDLDVDERIILKRILRKYIRRVWTELNFLRMGTVSGKSCEHDNETPGSI